MSEAVFNRLYKNLNQRQREAVDTIQGPVMVIAGPGTGKTSILTLRIANILKKTDTAPDSILALTFTEGGAYSMRRKLVEIIGAAAYRVGIFTFHGFANRIIERFKESFPRIVGSRPATAVGQIKILERIFLRNRFKMIRPFGDIFYYVPKALRAIRILKQENISPSAFKRLLTAGAQSLVNDPVRRHTTGRFKGELKASVRARARQIEKSLELAAAYRQYEDALARERLFDFEDMILEAIRALEGDDNVLRTIEEEYQYILADEHQDANNAQNRLLELLVSFDDFPNLFIVGDEKQAIYRFQGASLENFLYFKNRFPNARLITLEENYRSVQTILDAAHSLMEKGSEPHSLPREILRPRLKGKAGRKAPSVNFFEFGKDSTEAGFLTNDIGRRLKDGTAPREIAVLFRDNEDAFPIAEALERTRIPFAVLSDENILTDEVLRKLLCILRAVSEPGNPALFVEMLHLDFLGVEPVSLYELLAYCHGRRMSVFDALRNPPRRRGAGKNGLPKILKIFADFSRWAGYAKNSGAGEAVEKIARESGFLSHLLGARGSLRALEKLDSLFSHLKELSAGAREFRLADFLDSLARLERHGMRISGKGARPEFYDSVTLLTAHRAKGLEFDVVYLVRAAHGHWGGRRSRTDFYIPLNKGGVPHFSEKVGDGGCLPLNKGGSRVREAGVVSPLPKGAPHTFQKKWGAGVVPSVERESSMEDEDERRLFYVALTRARKEVVITMAREGDGGRRRLPSQFIEDIAPQFVARKDTGESEKAFMKRAPLYLAPRINAGPSIGLREYLQKVFLEQGLTVTALNNYLSCPWEYFFKNLVRVPQLPAPYLLYGTAMHEALREFSNARGKNKKIGAAGLLRFFNRALERTSLPKREFAEYKARGARALRGYLKTYEGSFSKKDALNEFEISGVFLPLGGRNKLLLRGVLDRIERRPDGTVTVVDYKTGKPKSRAEILGQTKSSNGDMKRQLDFYKLLLDIYEKGKYRMTEGIIDFLEPDKNGTYRRESFEIIEKDASAVAEEVERVGEEIYRLAFWDKRCGNKKCEWCRLRQQATF